MSPYSVLNKEGKEIYTNTALHPGEVLLMELEERGIKKSAFAAQLSLKPSHFSELLHCKRHVGASLALKLEKLLDIEAEYWMRVQVHYDLFMERKKSSRAA